MIGQKQLLESIGNLKDKFPRFSIISGAKGSGKKTLSKEISKILEIPFIEVSTKIEDIRNMIDTAYKQTDPLIFIINDADNMSLGAKNSLLKITEEPPRQCYFLMTLISLDNTLETIRSRGTVFALEPYSLEDLIQYRVFRGYSNAHDDMIKRLCKTTGEVDEIFSYEVVDFFKFCNNVVNNIHVPKNGNAFKITKLLKLKDTDKAYEPKMALRIIAELFIEKAKTTKKKQYLEAAYCTSAYIRQLNNAVFNKQAVLDMWIIDVRRKLVDV